MKKANHQQTLSKIQRTFAEHRASHGKRVHYSESLKQLAALGAKEGILTRAVATAAGVSYASICIWQKTSTHPQPKQLRIVRETSVRNTENIEAKLELAEGVIIKLPIEALTGELLQRLRGGEV